ncbi:MAG: kynureninase [Phycisphaeraceae bacterium]|nr:kynureninase [Phycisphaeraceae bacterium]
MTTMPASLDIAARDFEVSRDFARHMDSIDPFASMRGRFACPRRPDGSRVAYFTGNSLGLMPVDARSLVTEVLEDWAELGVEGHLEGRRPWLRYHEALAEPGARLVGGHADEVVMMNTLTVNLHLMMVSFYRPAGPRTKVLMEASAFPSDHYAIETHVASRGLDPARTVVKLTPRQGEVLLRTEDIVAEIERLGDSLALVLLGGVGFTTGQWFDIPAITRQTQRVGAVAGWDLAHAVGNVPLQLHEWGVDFACWCSYKYLNSGPGAVAGAFIHRRHAQNTTLPRYAGWWGNDPDTRFRMESEFVARPSADGWQLSNPPILSMAPVIASLALFDEAGGVAALRGKSRVLTGYFDYLLRERAPRGVTVITPADAEARGCQLSLRVQGDAADRQRDLADRGFWLDKREPDILRAAPVPLYNSFEEVWRLVDALAAE